MGHHVGRELWRDPSLLSGFAVCNLCTTESVPDKQIKVLHEGDLRDGKKPLLSHEGFLLLMPILILVATD